MEDSNLDSIRTGIGLGEPLLWPTGVWEDRNEALEHVIQQEGGQHKQTERAAPVTIQDPGFRISLLSFQHKDKTQFVSLAPGQPFPEPFWQDDIYVDKKEEKMEEKFTQRKFCIPK